jgi:hypothetical protein
LTAGAEAAISCETAVEAFYNSSSV